MTLRYLTVALLASIFTILVAVLLVPYLNEQAAIAQDHQQLQSVIDDARKAGY